MVFTDQLILSSLEGGEGVNPAVSGERNSPGRRNSKCKDLEEDSGLLRGIEEPCALEHCEQWRRRRR